jgi:uncharacterized protein YbcI
MFFEKPITNTIKTVIGLSVAVLWMDVSVHQDKSILVNLFHDIKETKLDRATDQVVDLYAAQEIFQEGE